MQDVIVNCQKVPFETTLGVAGYLLKLCAALSPECNIIFAVNDEKAFQTGPAHAALEGVPYDVISIDALKGRPQQTTRNAIELVPHHFQAPAFCEKSVLICHDLHVFDIPWKYKNVTQMQENFRNNLLAATAVVTHFPRTYYLVERIAGITLMNLFLTESPLMLDTSVLNLSSSPIVSPKGTPELLYPAQLQTHKNHEVLMRAVRKLKDEGRTIRLLCPGSEFKPDLTKSLKERARNLSVENEVLFLGRISDEELLKLYSRCDGVIVASLAEGGAYVPMEALAAGKPVAVHNLASARMHLQSVGGQVIWFDATSADDTANAIKQLADAHRDDWLFRNAEARERIEQMTWPVVAEKWVWILEWLQGRRDRPILKVDRNCGQIAFA